MVEDYFHHVRSEIEPLLPRSAKLIVDVGAGAGRTGAWVKSRYPGSRVIALEGNPAMREELGRNVDQAIIANLDEELPDFGPADLILFLDVLEHLTQPEVVLKRLTSSISDLGTVIVSVPNIAHASVSLPLLFRGRFKYQNAGILDRTHLRFFVQESALALLNDAGFIVRRGMRSGLTGPRSRILDRITLGMVRPQLTKQYIMAATRASPGERQGPVAWMAA